VKTEAIEKAHKVIQAMNEELAEGNKLITRMEEERDRLRVECRQAGKHIKEVGKRVQIEYERERAIGAERVLAVEEEVDRLRKECEDISL
jgi:hypothetical protein